MEDSHYKFYIRESSVDIVKGLKIVTVGLIISGLVVSGILLTSTTVLQASSTGLKLYLTVDTNLRNQDIEIETYQRGDNIYGNNGFMITGSNEYTLNYPNGLIDTGSFQVCINTNDGRFCGDGNNSEQKQPEKVFINAYEGRNFGSVPETDVSTSQSQASRQEVEQETSQSQSQSGGDTIIYNCPANARCVIEER